MAQVNAFFNLEAEKALLSGLASGQSPQRLARELSVSDLYGEANQRIFQAIQALEIDGKPVNIPAIAQELTELNGNDDDMASLLESIRAYAFTPEYAAREHVKTIRSASLRRQIYTALEDGKSVLMDGRNDAETALEQTRQRLRELTSTGHRWHSAQDVMLNTFAQLERRAKGEEKGIPVGIPMLDKHMAGLHRGELTVIGARPAVGKSALGAHIAIAAAKAGFQVGVCSREMTDVQYGTRMIARQTDVNPLRLRTGELQDGDWNQIADAMGAYSGLEMDFLFTARYIEDLRMEAQNRADAGKLDLLVVDYLQLMQARQRFDKDYQRIAYVSKMLKDMSVDFNIAVVALAQVGRAASENMPTLAELRGSGDIEQDADNVIFMHRPKPGDACIDPADTQLINGLEPQKLRYIVLDIAKQRQGETGKASVIFDPARMWFREICREEAP